MLIKNIYATIRKRCLSSMIFPALLLLASMAAFFYIPFTYIFHPVDLIDPSSLSKYTQEENPFVTCRIPKLYYTGSDYYKAGKLAGHYYYYFIDNTCYLALLDSTSPEPAQELEAYQATGKLEKTDSHTNSVLESLAHDIDWTYEKLAAITDSNYLSEPAYDPKPYEYLFLVLCIFDGAVAVLILINLFYLFCPDLHPYIRRLKPYGNTKMLLLQAQDEFTNDCRLVADDTFITSHYLIELGSLHASIVPLDSIQWIYRLGTWKKFLFLRIRLTYTLFLYLTSHQKLQLKGKRTDATLSVLNYFQDPAHELTAKVQYTEEYRKLFQGERYRAQK